MLGPAADGLCETSMKGSPMTKIPTNIASIRMPLKEISLATASLHPARGIVGAGISTLALILASASPAFAQEIIDDKVNDGVATVPGDQASPCDRKSVVEGKSVSVRVGIGGRRIIKKKKKD